MDLEAFVTSVVFGYLMVFARIGSAVLFMPGFGETQFPVRVRLTFALVLSLALYPIVPAVSDYPDNPGALFLLLSYEVTIGLWMGLVARILLSGMEFAGYQVGQVTGLANAFGPGLGSFEGATLMASFLLIATVALLFVTDSHHMILRALLDSYEVFPQGFVIRGDLAHQVVKAGTHSLYIGTAIAAPFFVMGVILNLGMGLANRMMPQLPVFFVGAPLLIIVGFLVLAAAAPSMITYWLSELAEWLGRFRF